MQIPDYASVSETFLPYTSISTMFPPSGGLSGILCFRLDLHACLGPRTCHLFFLVRSLGIEATEVIGMA